MPSRSIGRRTLPGTSKGPSIRLPPLKPKKLPEIVADKDYLDGINDVIPTVRDRDRKIAFMRRKIREWKRRLEAGRRSARWVLTAEALRIEADMGLVLTKKEKPKCISPI